MAYLAIRGSGAINGVSRVHGEVSRKIFQELFPRWPQAEVPVGHVTNGMHVPTWASAEAVALWNRRLRARTQTDITPVSLSGSISPRHSRGHSRCRTLGSPLQTTDEADRLTLARDSQRNGQPSALLKALNVDAILMPRYPYARVCPPVRGIQAAGAACCMIPSDFARILTDPARPAQLVLPAKHILQMVTASRHQAMARFHSEVRLAEPRGFSGRLRHAADAKSGTRNRSLDQHSTAALGSQWHQRNEGPGEWRPELSELDGWWAEAIRRKWAGDRGTGPADEDGRDAEQLYRLLEEEVKAAFYDRDASGIPTAMGRSNASQHDHAHTHVLGLSNGRRISRAILQAGGCRLSGSGSRWRTGI